MSPKKIESNSSEALRKKAASQQDDDPQKSQKRLMRCGRKFYYAEVADNQEA